MIVCQDSGEKMSGYIGNVNRALTLMEGTIK